MIVLGVDTSSESLMVSLIDDKRILANCNSIGTLKHSSLLFPAIQKSLKKIKAAPDDIDLLAVGLGPGSFTGLRVGITSMRGLAIALNKPIIGVPTMDAIAENGFYCLRRGGLLDRINKVCVILDAKKSQVYACSYAWDGMKIARVTGYLLEPIDKLSKKLRGKILFIGNGVDIYKDALLGLKRVEASFGGKASWIPKASTIARIGLEDFMKGKTDNPYKLVPMYLYGHDCNVKRN